MNEHDMNIDLVVAWRRNGGYDFMRLETAPELKSRFMQIVAGVETSLQIRRQKPFSIGDDLESDESMRVALADLALPPVSRNRPTKWARADRPAEFRRRLVTFPVAAAGIADMRAEMERGATIAFYALVSGVEPDDRNAYIRHRNPLQLLKSGNFFAGLGDTLTSIDQDIFVMDESIDLVLRPDSIDILNATYFASLFFEMSASDRAQHEALVRNVLRPLPVAEETLQRLVSSIQDGRSPRRKMLTLQESKHLVGISMRHFRGALRKHSVAAGRFIDRSGQISASEDDVGQLLEILNEDLYDGYLTGRRLVVSKKGVRS